MRQLSLGLLLTCVLASGAWASPSTYSLDGTLADGGTLSGTVVVDLDTVAQVNVHGWTNTTYPILGVDVAIHPTWSLLLGTVQYTNPATAEWCQGVCTFGGGVVGTSLRLFDGVDLVQMSWGVDGGLLPSVVKVAAAEQPVPGFTLLGMEVVRMGALQPVAVPEPDFWLLLAAGVVIVIGVARFYGEDLHHV